MTVPATRWKTETQPSPSAVPSRCAYSILICTHNRAEILPDCLNGTLCEAISVDQAGEVLLIDNASTDNTRDIFQSIDASCWHHGQLRYVFEAKPGLCIARNRGIEAASGDIIIFLDDDAIPARGWLMACLTAFATYPQALAVGGKIAPLVEGPTPEWFRPPLTHIYTVMDLGGAEMRPFPRGGHPFGANMAFRREVFGTRRFSEELGRRGNSLMSGEEAELCASIESEGGQIIYAPRMEVDHLIHPSRLTKAWVRERYWYDGISRAAMHLGWRAHAVMTLDMGAKLLLFALGRPLLRSDARRLLWNCRILKCRGYFSELMGLARH